MTVLSVHNSASSNDVTVHRKVAVMGIPFVGKTRLSQVYTRSPDENGNELGQMNFHDYVPTIENRFEKELVFIARPFKVHVTDTAGQRRGFSFPSNCALGVDGFVLVYAINDRQSFDVLSKVRAEIVENVGCDKVPTVLVGNKLDIAQEHRVVSHEEGKQLAESWPNTWFIEASAKDQESVDEVFEQLLVLIQLHRTSYNTVDAVRARNRRCILL